MEVMVAEDTRFETFVRANLASLTATAFLLCGNRHAAEELVQDTLALLYPRWDRVASAESPLAYVRRSLTNRFLSQRRSPRSRDMLGWELPERSDGADLAETVVARRTVWGLLGRLPQRQRAAIVLRHFHDLPEQEIAELLGCRPASVRSLISRGMATMRADFDRPQPAFERGSTR